MTRTKGRVAFRVNTAWCKKCGICTEFCPRKVFVEGEDGYPVAANPDACTQCGLCELLCPDQAMGLTVLDEGEGDSDAA